LCARPAWKRHEPRRFLFAGERKKIKKKFLMSSCPFFDKLWEVFFPITRNRSVLLRFSRERKRERARKREGIREDGRERERAKETERKRKRKRA